MSISKMCEFSNENREWYECLLQKKYMLFLEFS